MNQLRSIISNAVFALQILLIFLLLFENKVSLPVWLQPLGRMHPLILHFPIALLVLVGLFQLFRKNLQAEGYENIVCFTLYITALSTSLAALMGFFLSREEGYSSNMLDWHKWTGVAVSMLTYGLLLVYENESWRQKVFNPLLALGVGTLLFTGHFGASLTHGEDYLWEPLMSEEKVSPQTPVYHAAIQPLLKAKCQSCHNPDKKKGKLDMSSVNALLKGGKNGPVWEAGDAASSHMIQRIHLPMEDDDHMPPDGKPQLSPDEIALLESWIDSGADTELTLAELEDGTALEKWVSVSLENNQLETPTYSFEAASDETIDELNDPFRSVYPLSLGSPALSAQLFVRSSFNNQRLEELLQVREQLVSLNLTDLPISDEHLKTIGQFENLEKLILNGTDITGDNFEALAGCKKLRSLAFSNTEVNAENARKALEQLPSLEEMYLWSTAISEDEVHDLADTYANTSFEYGYIPEDSLKLPLTPPVLVNESNVLSKGEKVELKHNFPGVIIRYTIDGTDPDSLKSPAYEGPVQVDQFTEVRTLAYHPDWLASRTASFTFFKEGFYPEEVKLQTRPNPQYSGSGGNTLFDGEKGKASTFRSPLWLGYRANEFKALFDFGDQPPKISHVTISYARNIGSYIMPPVYVEVWAGNDPDHLQQLIRIRPPQALAGQATTEKGLDIEIPKSEFRYYQLIAQPIMRLPNWHRGAGDKGWFFVDEVFWY